MRLSAGIIVGVACWASWTLATGAPAGDMLRAKNIFLRGQSLFKKAQYPEALESFQASLKILPRHSTHLWIGHVYRKLNRPDKALKSYRKFLDLVTAKKIQVDHEVKKDIWTIVSRLKMEQKVFEDGRHHLSKGNCKRALSQFRRVSRRSRWPAIYVEQARCHLQLGRAEQARKLARKALGIYRQYLANWRRRHLDRPAPDQAEILARISDIENLDRSCDIGILLLQGLPEDAEVRVDGVHKGTAPLGSPLKLPVGKHKVAIEANGYHTWTREFSVKSGMESLVAVDLKPSGVVRRSRLWLASGITTAVLAAGFEAAAWTCYAKGNEVLTSSPEFDTYYNMVIAGHVLAGALAVASGVSWIMYVKSGERKKPPMSIGVLPAPGSLLVTAGGRF